MKKELTIGLLTVALTLGLASTVTAQDTEESDVDVNVSEVTQLDVRPSQLTYGNAENVSIEPGDNATISDGGYEHIELGNIGSTNIAEIYAQSTMPSDQPFGAAGLDETVNHNTGNFLTLSTETANTNDYSALSSGMASVPTMHFLNRVEYAEDTPPTYISYEKGSNLAAGEDDIHIGRIRAGGVEYFYALYNEDSANGVSSDGTFTLRIGDSPHTSTQLGTVDFTDEGTDYTEYTAGDASTEGGDDYAEIREHDFVTFDAGEGNYSGESLINAGDAAIPGDVNLVDAQTRSYDLYAHADSGDTTDAHILRSKFNIDPASPTGDDAPGEQTGGDQTTIFSSTTPDQQLQPGDSFPVDIGIQVPQGIDQSRITEGTVTIIASGTQ